MVRKSKKKLTPHELYGSLPPRVAVPEVFGGWLRASSEPRTPPGPGKLPAHAGVAPEASRC